MEIRVMGSHEVVGFPSVQDKHYQMVTFETCFNTDTNQFDGQALWPVVWQFLARWILVQSHHCHLKTTQALQRNKPPGKADH